MREECWNEAKSVKPCAARVIFCHVSLFQGYKEHRGEAAWPFEKNRLQYLGFKGPDQYPERVCSVIVTTKGIKFVH